jgi:hypothetical protein
MLSDALAKTIHKILDWGSVLAENTLLGKAVGTLIKGQGICTDLA